MDEDDTRRRILLYRDKAEEALSAAKRTTDHEAQKIWFELATGWTELADQIYRAIKS
jgi:hypothetical protein